MIVLELPLLFPTDEGEKVQDLGLNGDIEIETKSIMNTFFLPKNTVIRVSPCKFDGKSNIFIDDMNVFYIIDAEYEATNAIIQDAVSKAEKI